MAFFQLAFLQQRFAFLLAQGDQLGTTVCPTSDATKIFTIDFTLTLVSGAGNWLTTVFGI